MPIFKDRVLETTTTSGTSSVSLGGAKTGYRAFSTAFVNNDVVYYCISGGTEWEVGYGTLTSGTPWVLSRSTILSSSNSGSIVTFSVGTKDVFCTLPASSIGSSVTETLTNKTIDLTYNTLTATSAQLKAALTDETGSGAAVFATTPTITTPVLSNPSYSGTTANGGTVTTITINGGTVNGTVIGGATPAAGSFTALSATGTVTGSNLSGTNTGDNAANTNYASDYRAANFVAGTNYVAPGGALGTPSSGNLANCSFPQLNQSTNGSSASCTGNSATATTANALNSANSYSFVNSLSSGYYARSAHSAGYLAGSYNNVGANDPKSNPIYCIGTSYAPTDTTIANMYGIGYSHSNFFGTAAGVGWGLYVVDVGVYSAIIGGAGAWFRQNVTAYSDIRVKTNLVKIDSAIDKIKQINGYTYDRTDMPNGGRQVGVIAQEIIKVLPEAVSGSEKDHYSVAYGNLAALFIEAIKEQQIEIEKIRDEIAELRSAK